MIIIELLENMRNMLGETKINFYNIILGTGMVFSKSTVKITDYIFDTDINSSTITHFSDGTSLATTIRQRFRELSNNKCFDDLAKHYRKKLSLPGNRQTMIFHSFKQKLSSAGVNIEFDTDDFYLYLAHVVDFYIVNFNSNIGGSYDSFIPTSESIFDQLMRIFNDPNINYIVIATQVGMMLVTNDNVRKAVKEYLMKGKTLEVIINSSDIRNTVGVHMRNFEISHQTDTSRICELWKKLKTEVGDANLMVATTDLPILHQVIKSSTMINRIEQNISVEVRMYAYLVSNKDDNISFTMTNSSDKYGIIEDELEYLRRNAVKEFIVKPEPNQKN